MLLAPWMAAAAVQAVTGWAIVTLPRVKPAEVTFAQEDGREVVRIRAHAAAASATRAFDPPRPLASLAWDWKVDRVVASADMARREGDDYAARVYVTFDVPLEALSFVARTKIRLARLFYGEQVPTAAICYVWDNRHPVGTSAWNAYTSQVRMVVVESGEARANQWVAVHRDVAADFRAAFGERHPGEVPAVTGVAVSSDTDQTGEAVTAWFRDVRWEPRP